MEMDGYTVAVGDSVHDMLYGPGSVTELMANNQFRVKFQTKPHGLVFTADVVLPGGVRPGGTGNRYTQRTLFWNNPIIAIPTKSERLWNMVRPVAALLVAQARASFGGES